MPEQSPQTSWLIHPHDPLVARDGRAFDAGSAARQHSLSWWFPSTLAGAYRTLLGSQIPGFDFAARNVDLLNTATRGPFPCIQQGNKSSLFFPRPLDAIGQYQGDAKVHVQVVPLRCTNTGLVAPPLQGIAELPAWWRVDHICDWLLGRTPQMGSNSQAGAGFYAGPEMDVRSHVAIEKQQRAGKPHHLYQTTALDLTLANRSKPMALAFCAAGLPDFQAARFAHAFGGERKLAIWQPSAVEVDGWHCPEVLEKALSGVKRARLILASPARFVGGWLPDGFDPVTKKGTLFGQTATIKAAIIPGWEAVSGYGYRPKGPKALHRVVPAGSVYFVEFDGPQTELHTHWLQPVPEQASQFQLDGFGLALWGLWI